MDTIGSMKKFLSLFSLLTIISLNGKILGIIRDTLILSLEDSNALVIPFVKIWFVIPTSMLLVGLYARLRKRLDSPKTFSLLTAMFCAFFLFFTFFIRPNIASLQAVSLYRFLLTILPESSSVFLAAIRDWPYTVFFLAAEMWTTFMFSFLFWSLASELVTKSESKNFYGYFSLDFAGILAGGVSLLLSYLYDNRFDGYLQSATLFIVGTCIVQVMLYHFAFWKFRSPRVNKNATDQMGDAQTKEQPQDKRPFYVNLFLLVFSFEFCDHFLEIIWKNHLQLFYTTADSLSIFMSKFIFYTGVVGVLITIFVSSPMLRRYRWVVGAKVTPIFVLLSSVMLFFCFWQLENGTLQYILPVNYNYMILVIATMQASFMKIAKFTFFDNSKEMALLSLSHKERIRARSICDTLSSRFGKSTSAIGWQGYTLAFGAMNTLLPIGLVVIGTAYAWNRVVSNLNDYLARGQA